VAVVWAFVTGAVALHQRRNPAAPLMALASAGVILVFLAELFFIRDVFFGSVPRLNTVFKLTYQAWILLSIAGAAALTVAAQRARLGNIAATAALLPVIAVVALALLYALGAIPNRADGFSGPTSIDGLS